MSKSEGYESITQAIFQALVDQDDVGNIDVQHDVTLRGKFLDHQVDVFWKFRTAGIEYSTVVECKDWNRPLEQEKLLAFRAKLEDLNNPKGIMVTRSGYQSGAMTYAKKHGIYLYQLFEEPPLTMTEGSFARFKATPYAFERDGKTSVSLILEWTRYEPQYAKNTYYLDNDWATEQVRQKGPRVKDKLRKLTAPKEPLSRIKLYDEERNEICSVLDIFKKKSEEMFHNGIATTERFVHKFSDPIFMKTRLRSLPLIKITALSTEIAINRHKPFKRAMKMEGLIHFILRNLQDGTEKVMSVKRKQD